METETQPKKIKSGWLNVAIDYGPLIVFLVTYYWFAPDDEDAVGTLFAIIRSTGAFILAALIALVASKLPSSARIWPRAGSMVRTLVENGWRCVATGRRRERLDALVAELGADKVHAAVFDVRDAAAMDAAIETLPAEFAGIDLLVNNAGLAQGLAQQFISLAKTGKLLGFG